MTLFPKINFKSQTDWFEEENEKQGFPIIRGHIQPKKSRGFCPLTVAFAQKPWANRLPVRTFPVYLASELEFKESGTKINFWKLTNRPKQSGYSYDDRRDLIAQTKRSYLFIRNLEFKEVARFQGSRPQFDRWLIDFLCN